MRLQSAERTAAQRVCSVLSCSPWQLVQTLFLSPATAALILVAFSAVIYLAVAGVYWHLLGAYKDGCIAEPHSGTLLGQNIDSYGRDLKGAGQTFPDLLRAVGSTPGLARMRFVTSHPRCAAQPQPTAHSHDRTHDHDAST